MPIDLILVRHGESEGNAAKRLAEGGNPTALARAVEGRHTRSFRLTEKGRRQAMLTGEWLCEHFPYGFDRCIVSEYTRAMETAGLLDLPNAEWRTNYELTERDWGDLDHCSLEEREERFGASMRMKDIEPFFWKPPNGESLSQVCQRLKSVLGTLHRECQDKRVIIVCHGEVMWAFRVLIERMPQHRFKELHLSKNPDHRIHNCQIIHYTRRDPDSGMLSTHADWRRMIRATANPVKVFEWEEIVRPMYTNDELLQIVSDTPALVA